MVFSSLTLSGAPAWGKAKKAKPTQRVVALFYAPKGKPNPKLYEAVFEQLIRATASDKSLKLLHGKALRGPLGRNPDAALEKCGNDATCIAKLVLYGRVAADGAGVKARFIVINVASRSIANRVVITVTSAAAAAAEVDAKLDELLNASGGSSVSTDDDEEIPLDAVVDATSSGGVITPAAAPAGAADELPLDLALAPLPSTNKGRPKIADEPVAPIMPPLGGTDGLRPGETTTLAVVAPDLGAISPPPALRDGRSYALTYVGIAVAALGAGGLGTGAYFGVHSRSVVEPIEYGTGGTRQLDADQMKSDSDASVTIANILFGVGGGLAAVGAGLIVLDLALGHDDDARSPAASLTVGAAGPGATLTWRW
jgi:hypothetical protein